MKHLRCHFILAVFVLVMYFNSEVAYFNPSLKTSLLEDKGKYRLGLATYRHPSTWCLTNPFLRDWDKSNFTAAAASLVDSRGTMLRSSIDVGWGAEGFGRFRAAPTTQSCHPMAHTLSGDKNGFEQSKKYLCNIEALREGCIVYSLGSNGQFEFENNLIQTTPCEIFVFDCTMGIPPVGLHPRIHFYPLCVGEPATFLLDADPNEGKNYRMLPQLVSMLGHSRIDLLKMDIEGYEYSVFEGFWRGAASEQEGHLPLPFQISFEQHGRTGMRLPWTDFGQLPLNEKQQLSTGDMALMWAQLADMGYVVIARENNPLNTWCVEWTVVRSFC